VCVCGGGGGVSAGFRPELNDVTLGQRRRPRGRVKLRRPAESFHFSKRVGLVTCGLGSLGVVGGPVSLLDLEAGMPGPQLLHQPPVLHLEGMPQLCKPYCFRTTSFPPSPQ